jgi:pimeloyl-ACP methyl ester carboxylesterase
LYVCTYQKPGRAEADFGRFDAKTVVRNVYILFSKSEIPIANENQEIMDLVAPDTPLPSWFSEEDLATYGALYEKSGFQTALQVPYRCCHLLLLFFPVKCYVAIKHTILLLFNFKTCFVCICRSFGEDFNLPDPIVKVPALLIMGGKDYVFKFPGIEELTKGEKAKEFVPNLEVTFIPEGTHFVQEQFPEQVNQLILAFLAKHT